MSGYRIRDALLVGSIGGNLAGYLKEISGEGRDLAIAITKATHARGRELRDALRAQVRTNFSRVPSSWRPKDARGQNLEKAVRHRTYPSSRATLGPASLVFIPWRLAEMWTGATTIRAAGGKWLAIPTKEAFRRGYATAEESRGARGKFEGGSRARASRIDRAIRSFGAGGVKLRFVKTGPDTAIIGIDAEDAAELGIKGARKRVGAKGVRRRTRLVPLFLLVRQVTLRQRLTIEPLAETAMQNLYSDIEVATRG